MLIGVAYLDGPKLHDHIRDVITRAVDKLEGDWYQISIRASELMPDVDLRFPGVSPWKLNNLCSSVPIESKKVGCGFATLMTNKGVDLYGSWLSIPQIVTDHCCPGPDQLKEPEQQNGGQHGHGHWDKPMDGVLLRGGSGVATDSVQLLLAPCP
jgi:hypothetical protein